MCSWSVCVGSMWWLFGLFVFCILLVIYTQVVAEEKDRALKRRPRLPRHIQTASDLQLRLPDDFIWGCATAAHQVRSCHPADRRAAPRCLCFG